MEVSEWSETGEEATEKRGTLRKRISNISFHVQVLTWINIRIRYIQIFIRFEHETQKTVRIPLDACFSASFTKAVFYD